MRYALSNLISTYNRSTRKTEETRRGTSVFFSLDADAVALMLLIVKARGNLKILPRIRDISLHELVDKFSQPRDYNLLRGIP